jgi:hypothetical protein
LTTAPAPIIEPRAAGGRRLRPSPSFLRFLARRLVALVLLSIGITLVVFALTRR